MSRILIVCPTHRDLRELRLLGIDRAHEIFTHDYASIELEELVAENPPDNPAIRDPIGEVERLIAEYSARGIDGVYSADDYPGGTFASLIASALRLSGVSPEANLLCQHKLHARRAQAQFAPEATPRFSGSAGELGLPVFMKPVKSFFSVGAYRCDTAAELDRWLPRATLPRSFFEPFDRLMSRYSSIEPTAEVVLFEDVLEGAQCTLEGYVFDGEIHIFGITDSVMFPGTIAFQRFDYPSRLSARAQERMEDIARRVMRGIGFDRGLFNIEFLVDEREHRPMIIEINPRMASQFADLYEKVDGYNSYEAVIDIALGRRPKPKRRAGKHAIASSCILRIFEDKLVARVPSEEEIAAVLEKIPDARVEVLCDLGKRLSAQMQDGRSYRYGMIDVGGRDLKDVLEQFEWAKQVLRFELVD